MLPSPLTPPVGRIHVKSFVSWFSIVDVTCWRRYLQGRFWTASCRLFWFWTDSFISAYGKHWRQQGTLLLLDLWQCLWDIFYTINSYVIIRSETFCSVFVKHCINKWCWITRVTTYHHWHSKFFLWQEFLIVYISIKWRKLNCMWNATRIHKLFVGYSEVI